MNGTIYRFETDMLHGESIYVSKKTDDNWYKKHWHNYYEIVYFYGCSGHCVLNGEKYEISDNCLFLLTPKDFHDISTQDSAGGYSLIIAFNAHIVDSAIADTLTQGPFISYDVSGKTQAKLDELYDVSGTKDEYRDVYMKHLFNCILTDILSKANTAASNDREISPIVRQSISIMVSAPTDSFSLDFFAKKFNVTTAYFSRLFHKSIGVSFKQYLTVIRLEYAKQLLVENVLPIIDVGYECGFNTPSQFYRAFKKAYSLTPSEYRKKNRYR